MPRDCSFDGFSEDPQQYGELTTRGFSSSCREAAVKAVAALQQHRLRLTAGGDSVSAGASASGAPKTPAAAGTPSADYDDSLLSAAAGGAGRPGTQPGPSRLGLVAGSRYRDGSTTAGGTAGAFAATGSGDAGAALGRHHTSGHHGSSSSSASAGSYSHHHSGAATASKSGHQPHAAAGPDPEYAAFLAEVNAKVVADAEAYYRAMFSTRVSSWNARDTHMVETIVALQRFLTQRAAAQAAAAQGQAREQLASTKAGAAAAGSIGSHVVAAAAAAVRPARIVVWAHNSHIGDARATEVSKRGEVNVGQLLRQAYPPGATYLIGQSTYTGTVTAAHNWDGEMRRSGFRQRRRHHACRPQRVGAHPCRHC